MRVKKILIKDFKAIKNLEAVIDGNIIISGENGKGKSSVMQFIEICLGRTNNIPPEATGEGYVIMDRDGNEYKFFVKFDKNGKPQLKITTPDGLSDERKGTIAKIVGAIEFDINSFLTQSKSEKGRKEQVETFKRLLPEEVREEILRLEANANTYYTERTEINKKLSDTKGAIAKHRLYGNDLQTLNKFKQVDTAAVLAELQAAEKHNLTLENVKERLAERNERKVILQGDGRNSIGLIGDAERQIKELQEKIRIYNLEIDDIVDKNLKAAAYLKENPVKDTQELETRITNADKENLNYRSAQELIQLLTDEVAYTNAAGDKTVALESQRQCIKDAIKDMSNPVPGLSYDDDSLYYNGIPVHPDSLAFSKQIELAYKLRVAENPNLPLFIPNGESLGREIRTELVKFANEHNLQIFMEQFKIDQDTLELEVMGDF